MASVQMEASNNDTIHFSGCGVLFKIVSTKQAIMRVQPQQKKLANQEYFVLIDKDVIFLNNKRCKNVVEIQGKAIALNCFRMQNAQDVRYRSMAVMDCGSVPKTLSIINGPLLHCKFVDLKIEGVVIGYGSVSEAIVEIKEGKNSYLVVCHETSFVKTGNWKTKYIFENVYIGEKVSLKVSLKTTRKYQYLAASAVYQKSTISKSMVPIVPVIGKDGSVKLEESLSQSPLIQDDVVTIDNNSLMKLTEKGIVFMLKSKFKFGILHGLDMSVEEIKRVTSQTLFDPCFTGVGVLVRVMSTSEAILIVQPQDKNIRVPVVIHVNDIYVKMKRCKVFNDIRKKYLFVHCIKTKYQLVDSTRTEKDALNIPFRAINAHSSGSKLPGIHERFNMANPLISKLDESKVYRGQVTAFATLYCAIVEVIENNTAHLVTLRKKAFLTSEKKSSVLAGCLRIGENLNLTFASQKLNNGQMYYRAVKSVVEGCDFPEESSCAVVKTLDKGSVRSASVASDSSSAVSKIDHAKLEIVPKNRKKGDPRTTKPSSVDTVSQVQKSPHLNDGSHTLTDIYRELESVNVSRMSFLELNEVVGIVLSYKSHSEGVLVIDALNIKVQFSIKNVVWWNEAEEREARLLSLQDLFPLASFLMVCALPTPGENIFRATKVWRPVDSFKL